MSMLSSRIGLSDKALNALRAGLLLVAGGAILVTVWTLRSDGLTEGRKNASDLATALAEQTTRTVQSIDLVVHDLQERIAAMNIERPEAARELLGDRDTHNLLRDKLLRLPQAKSISIISFDGKLVNSTGAFPALDVDVTDREYYRHFLTASDADPFVGSPVASRLTGVRSIHIARRVNNKHGVMIGIVQASIAANYFEDIFASVARSHPVSLTRGDGTILVTRSSKEGPADTALTADRAWRAVVDRGGGFYKPPSGDVPATAVHPLREYDLVMNVGLNEEELAGRWQRQALAAMFGPLIILLCALALLRAFRSKSRALQVTLNNMAQGIMMVDAKRRIPVMNRQAVELLGLPDEMLTRRTTFDEILDYQRLSGEFGKEGAAVDKKVWRVVSEGGMAYNLPVYERVRPNGTALEIRTVPLPDGGVVRTYSDITARKRAEEEVRRMAFRDNLTGLANRMLLNDRLAQCFDRYEEHQERFAVLCLDLDRFKAINDTLGHAAGDALLKQVAARLLNCVRSTDLVARVGGDEFVVVHTNIDDPMDVIALVHRLLTTVGAPYSVNGQRISAGTSIGIAIAPGDGDSPDEILKHADLALYKAKSDGRGAYCFFEPEMHEVAAAKASMEADLHAALERGEFEIHYLPWVNCITDRIAGCEALVRWQHPKRGMLGPSEFIPLAEDCGLIGQIGKWVLERATQEARNWPADIRLAVNVSAAQFLGDDLADTVLAALASSGLPPERLELEVTESLLLFERGDQRATLQQLRRHGVRIALDDFGTGYSSFSYLDVFPFSRIKIDRSFVSRMLTRPHCGAIVAAIVNLGRDLNMSITAEGVETPEQMAALKAAGCSDVQGFLFGKPRKGEDTASLLSNPTRIHSAA